MLKGKKGQVTIFVVIALVIIFAVVFTLFFRERIPVVTPTEKDPKTFIETCMHDSAAEAAGILSQQGGSLRPLHYILYQNKKVEYLCYTAEFYKSCVNQNPLLKRHVEDEIAPYVSAELQKCVSELRAEKIEEGYAVDVKKADIAVTLQPKKIIIDLNMPLTLTKEKATRYDKFHAVVFSPLYEFASLAQEVTNSEVDYGDFSQIGYMLLNMGIKVEKTRITRNLMGSTIYTLIDRQSGKQFIFAIRSYEMPPGF